MNTQEQVDETVGLLEFAVSFLIANLDEAMRDELNEGFGHDLAEESWHEIYEELLGELPEMIADTLWASKL